MDSAGGDRDGWGGLVSHELKYWLFSSEAVARIQSALGVRVVAVVDENEDEDGEVLNGWQQEEDRSQAVAMDRTRGTVATAGSAARKTFLKAAAELIIRQHLDGATGRRCRRSGGARKVVEYEIGDLFWFFVFVVGAEMADALGAFIFFSWSIWNVDFRAPLHHYSAVAISFFFAQALKDVVRWPRPSMPPAVQMEHRIRLEPGMPSTHALCAVAIAVGFLLNVTHYLTLVPPWACRTLPVAYALLALGSRVYLGAHTLADVVAGAVIGGWAVLVLMPVFRTLDNLMLFSWPSPILLVLWVVLLHRIYPPHSASSPAKLMAMKVLAVWLGMVISLWFLRCSRLLGSVPNLQMLTWLGMASTLRMVVGLAVLVLTKILVSKAFKVLETMANPRDGPDKASLVLMSQATVSYFFMGVAMMVFSPCAFQVLGILRPELMSEVSADLI